MTVSFEPIIEKGSAFYLLRKRDVDDSLRVYEVTSRIYERIIGPVPMQELTANLPEAFLQIPPLCWGRGDVMKAERQANKPRLGDLIVCNDSWGTMTAGFFTTKGFADNMLQQFPFVEWPSDPLCGFLHLPGSILHHTITTEIKELI